MQVAALDQNTRDTVAKGMMRLTLKELFVLHTMQTDPNWSNFLYDAEAGKVNLIDFGASVEYPREFCVNYGRLVNASAERDRAEIIKVSREMGFLTGQGNASLAPLQTPGASHHSSVMPPQSWSGVQFSSQSTRRRAPTPPLLTADDAPREGIPGLKSHDV